MENRPVSTFFILAKTDKMRIGNEKKTKNIYGKSGYKMCRVISPPQSYTLFFQRTPIVLPGKERVNF